MKSLNRRMKTRATLVVALMGLWIVLAGSAALADGQQYLQRLPSRTADVTPTVICKHQTYALCATASCFVYNGLAYCQCDVRFGKSISAPYNYPVLGPPGHAKQNICDLNAQGAGNGFMASLYSLPPEILKGGNKAIYTCPSDSIGAYAQCDGGLCFDSTRGKTFPGFNQPLGQKQIICSCPITEAANAQNPLGYQFVGPYPCNKKVFEMCGQVTNELNGSTIPVGSPSGAGRLLTTELYGTFPQINECLP
jgi:hypothetical protein